MQIDISEFFIICSVGGIDFVFRIIEGDVI